jgi:putative molybdopterin biosynthesis protein
MRDDIYLKTVSLEEALGKWEEKVRSEGLWGGLEGEAVRVADSLGRVTAGPVSAAISSPFYHSSAMDGYAVRFAETFGATESSPKALRIGEEAVYVDTGDPMPEGGFNAVIMIEDVNVSGDRIEIISPLTPWQNVRAVGEDIVATEMILPENQVIRPVDMGAMLAGGLVEVKVRRRPRVAVIPTGTELVEPGAELRRGNIIEYNSSVLCGLLAEWGGECIRRGIVPDDKEKLKEAVLRAHAEADLIAVNAGASAGSEDHTPAVIGDLGEVIVHGLDVKPGKPAVLGWIKGKPVIGVPGYPVSAYITFLLFVRPLIMRWLGLPDEEEAEEEEEKWLSATLSRQVASQLGQEEFLRMKIGKVGEKFIATPLGRGAGLMMSLVRADGFLKIPRMSEGIGAGAEVKLRLIRSRAEIKNTVVSIGSHDNTMDVLANALRKKRPGFSLSSANVGSMGGLMAIGKGEAHLAPTHLLDEETGEYNVPFIKKLLPGRKVALINLVYRRQGLMVPPGNPKGIRGFRDLLREEVTYINRQRGAGTRLLLDKHLKELGISPVDIKGYEREEYTHMAVASAVLSGVADTGLGIMGASNALGLEFLPVADERYDLLIPGEFLEMKIVRDLLEIIREDREFREEVLAIGGYGVKDMGREIWRN